MAIQTQGTDPLTGLNLGPMLGNYNNMNGLPWAIQLPTSLAEQGVTDIGALLPGLTSAQNQATLGTSLGNLGASAATSQPYYSLLANLMNQNAQPLAGAGANMAGANIGANMSLLNGPGSQLLGNLYGLNQALNPTQMNTITSTGGRLQDLFNNIDLSGGLSDTERGEIAKGLAREGYMRGTANAPSNTDTIANAMQYGQAGYQRKQQAISNLSDAIGKSAAFLPNAGTGFNIGNINQIGSGNASINPGSSMFSGVQAPDTSTANNLLSGLSNQYGQFANTGLGAQANWVTQGNLLDKQIAAQKKDWMDYLVQSSQIFSNIAGGAKGAAGL